MGRKLADHAAWSKYHGSGIVALDNDERSCGMRDMEANLVGGEGYFISLS